MHSRRWLLPALAALTLLLLPAILLGLAVILAYPTLPSLEVLTDYRPKIPLRIYSAEGSLIGEFGEERRALVTIAEVPEVMKQAILAAEDDRFYEHGGVDYMGVIRAAISNFTSGDVKQGASTITMQVARNFFLSKEKTITRKFNEVLLTFKIEHSISKDEILQLYINQIYLGQRAYGFAAASQIYFGKPLGQVTVAEAAMLAGLPKAPSLYNPIVNPQRAKQRQLYVLRRMHELNFVNDEQLQLAQQQIIVARRGSQEFGAKADYLAEMVRQAVYEQYKDDTYTQGFKVYTTIRQQDQLVAYRAVRAGVLDYDRRHGYRGPEGYIALPKDSTSANYSAEQLEEALQEITDSGDLIPAVVLEASPKSVRAYCKGGEIAEISGDALLFVQPALTRKVALNQRINVGSLIRVQKDNKGIWQISQLPEVEAAFVSGNPRDGAIYALIGGFDFNRNQFNHITQAWRQPGSSFKPFVYSAALEKGFTPATVINDAPLIFDAEQTGNEPWQPKNYDEKFEGPMRMRQALLKSKNLVSIRILQSITPQYARDYITRFGFDASRYPAYLTMALGAGSATPMQMLTGYSVFANGGFRVAPYFIQRIEDANGNVLSKANPVAAGEGAEQVIDVRNAYTMVSMLQDVVKHGTAFRAMQLGRQDLAGKTGTTNDSVDAWFCGFHPSVVGISWIGYDQPRSLGDRETGGGAALPIWMSYMETTLKDAPPAVYTMPENMVAVPINEDGNRDENSSRIEYFYLENAPAEQAIPVPGEEIKPADTIKDQLLRLPIMSKEYIQKRDLMREQLAHQAAKLMAEDGITDHAFAKRKAARQLGAADTQHLPSNQEVDDALHSYRALYQRDSHPGILRQLRQEALDTMRLLEPFHPYLTGSVLSGTAGAQSDINLMLFSDDAKAVLLFLLKHNIAFEDGEWKVHFAGRDEKVPSYTMTGKSGVQIHIIVLPENARHSGTRHPETHADIAAVEALLAY